MRKKKILFASQEISPYLPETYMSNVGLNLPKHSIEQGNETRIFLPKFGIIKEKANNLHEVIRLSGMNLIIDDFDHQLIIKVASIQSARMQIYFIDNDEYFPRKTMFLDEKGNFLPNTEERIMFYCKGVIETVKKLGWSPEIIYCQGWFSSLIPMYIKKIFNEDPLFKDTKVIYSVFDTEYKGSISPVIVEKLLFENNLEKSDLDFLRSPTFENLSKFAISYSDAIIQGSENINKKVLDYMKESELPFMEYPGEENYEDQYNNFFDSLVEEEELELTEEK